MALCRRKPMHYQPNGQTKKAVDLAHPLTITLCKVIIDRYNMHTLSLKRNKICRQCGNKRFSLACFHLCNSALKQYDAARKLHGKMTHTQNTP